MAESKPTADEVEDAVLNTLPTLSVAELLGVCELVGVEVKGPQKDSRRILVRLLMKFLCTDEDEDDRMTEFLQISDHLQLNKVKEEEEDKGASVDGVAAEEETSDLSKTKQVKEESVEEVPKIEIIIRIDKLIVALLKR